MPFWVVSWLRRVYSQGEEGPLCASLCLSSLMCRATLHERGVLYVVLLASWCIPGCTYSRVHLPTMVEGGTYSRVHLPTMVGRGYIQQGTPTLHGGREVYTAGTPTHHGREAWGEERPSLLPMKERERGEERALPPPYERE